MFSKAKLIHCGIGYLLIIVTGITSENNICRCLEEDLRKGTHIDVCLGMPLVLIVKHVAEKNFLVTWQYPTATQTVPSQRHIILQ